MGQPANTPALWGVTEVCQYLGVAPSTLYRIIDRDDTFPSRIRLSARAVRFRGDLVVAWADRQADASTPRPLGRRAKPVRAL